MSVAEIKELKKSYKNFTLDNVSFELEDGKITGFIGRNGAGKTTTIKSMLGLVHKDGGEINYFGLSLCEHENEIKQRIGYSSGAVSFYQKKKIRDIVAVTKRFYDNWDDGKYHEYCKLFDIDENKCPDELSDGMKVKFNLLLALSHRSEILILDEPTSCLDPFSRDEILDIFTELKKSGTAILFSTHITSDIEKCADNIIYISGGRIVASLGKQDFIRRFSINGETLEETVLRLERSNRNG